MKTARGRSFWKRQWSFVLGGLVVGLGETIYFLCFGTFIPVTTGLAKMFATVESHIPGVHHVSRAYSPDIHWIIIGALFGAWFVGRLEKESRNWVKYSPGMLLIALFGGIIFGFGTRLGPGCTTHHIFGGLSVMSIASWTIAIMGLPFAFLAFEFVAWMGYGPYFKHQENRQTVLRSKELGLHNDHRLVLDEGYKPWRNPLRMTAWVIVAIVVVSSLHTGIFGNTAQSLTNGPLLPNIIRFVAGICLGFGIAKAGVGTECGLMAPESLLVPESHYRKMNIPRVTQRMFRALMPVAGILAAIITLNVAVLVMWLFFGWDVPDAAPKPAGWGLHIGHLMAAPCLAVGSVFMIGCEIRSYGRIGLGYLTGIVGLLGFYIGYLPYVYLQEPIDGFIAGHTFIRSTNIAQLVTADPTGQKIAGVVYTALLIGIFFLVVRKGSRMIGAGAKEYLLAGTDELCIREENEEMANNRRPSAKRLRLPSAEGKITVV